MQGKRVADLSPYLQAGGAGWSHTTPAEIALTAAPLGLQPTEYVRKAWEGKAYGQTNPLRVAAVHDGTTLALLMSWRGVAPGGRDFPDAIALAVPVRGNPPLATMGAPDAPIHLLRWQADRQELRTILATGIGSSRPGPDIECEVRAWAADDTWNVVISRPLRGSAETASLVAGQTARVGFAVWRGDNDERAGIKAFSIDWTELALDA